MYGLVAVVIASLIVAAHIPPWGLVFWPVAIFIGLITAYPLYLGFVVAQKTEWRHGALGGAVSALVVGFLGLLLDRPISLWYLVALVPWAASGALLGMIVWLIGIYLNPAYPYRNRDKNYPINSCWLVLLLPVVYGYLGLVSGRLATGCIKGLDSGTRPPVYCERYVSGTTKNGESFSSCWLFGKFDGSEVGKKVTLWRYRGPDLAATEYKVSTFNLNTVCD